MKNKIWQKYLLCMVVVLVLVGLSLNLIGYRLACKEYENEHRRRLQDESRQISVEYVKESRNAGLTSEMFQQQLLSVSRMIECEIWIVSQQGSILMSTEPEMVGSYVPRSVLDQNWDKIIADARRLIFLIDLVALAFLVMGTALWAGFAMYHTKNVRTLQEAVVHYTNGDFDHEIKIDTRDEYRDLANAIHLLADQHANLVEYQKNFIANISHDFRSPLTSIKGYAEAIKDGTIPYEIQGKYLNIILFETDRLANLTNDLLDLSNFENKGVHLSFTNFDITKMLKQSAMTFEGKCSQKNLKIRLSFPENTLIVHADKGKIQQVVHNLIDNAIKFSHPDGIIYVSVMERREKVLVSVRDTGIGIPKESISKVWERFYKTDLSRGKDKRGTGLGLSITKQIIAAHNENIKVSSTEGVGTEFVFSLAKAVE